MKAEDIDKFAEGLRGQVIRQGDADYDEARKVYNGMIDKRPLLIARCVDAGDVIAAVNFGRDSGLPIAIRGGGHNGPGLGSVNDGLVIDLSLMRGVRVDPKARTVRVGPGCTTGEVDHATHAFGQAVPFGIISTTGVAGLTLSGGHGYLSRQYGLAIDNLIEADVVLAEGSFATASETDNADLLWALRGGGGNFGVVTSFLFRTHPAKMRYGGLIVFELSDAKAVMRWYREFLPRAPDDFYVWLGLQSVPPGAVPEGAPGQEDVRAAHRPQRCRRRAAVSRIRGELPKPIIDGRDRCLHGAAKHVRRSTRQAAMVEGDFVRSLPDEAIDAHIENASKASVFSTMHLLPIDAAVQRRRRATWHGARDAHGRWSSPASTRTRPWRRR